MNEVVVVVAAAAAAAAALVSWAVEIVVVAAAALEDDGGGHFRFEASARLSMETRRRKTLRPLRESRLRPPHHCSSLLVNDRRRRMKTSQ